MRRPTPEAENRPQPGAAKLVVVESVQPLDSPGMLELQGKLQIRAYEYSSKYDNTLTFCGVSINFQCPELPVGMVEAWKFIQPVNNKPLQMFYIEFAYLLKVPLCLDRKSTPKMQACELIVPTLKSRNGSPPDVHQHRLCPKLHRCHYSAILNSDFQQWPAEGHACVNLSIRQGIKSSPAIFKVQRVCKHHRY